MVTAVLGSHLIYKTVIKCSSVQVYLVSMLSFGLNCDRCGRGVCLLFSAILCDAAAEHNYKVLTTFHFQPL